MFSVPSSVIERRFRRGGHLAAAVLLSSLMVGLSACGDTLYEPDTDSDDGTGTPPPPPPPSAAAPALTVEVLAPERIELTDSVIVNVRGWDPFALVPVDSLGYTAIVRGGGPERALTGRIGFQSAAGDTVAATFVFRPDWLTQAELPASLDLEVYGTAINESGICSAAVEGVDSLFECERRLVGGDSVTVGTARAAAVPVLVVRGRTTLFRSGGILQPLIGDLVVDVPRERVYLSDRFGGSVRVFHPAQFAWGADVSVGAGPWGLHINRTGDTLLVANSGGTSISRVALNGVPREVVAQRLQVRNTPLFLVPHLSIVDSVGYVEFSDRPQYVVQDSLGRILYSTRPTAAEPRGTVRVIQHQPGWQEPETQNLVRLPEDAVPGGPDVAVAHVDSIRGFADGTIEVYDRVPGFPPDDAHLIRSGRRVPLAALRYMRDSTESDIDFLDPDSTQDPRGWIGGTSMWGLDAVSFSDTTYAAVSKNRGWVAFGDGGQPAIGRVVLWHAGTAKISSRVPVADLIANASERVRALELNRNGTLGVARGAFGTYFFSRDLRLRGLVPEGVVGGGGAALHPDHPDTPAPLASSEVTVAFTMTGDRAIRILDTVHYRERNRILVRDAIAGPMRVSPPLPSDNNGQGSACSGPNCIVAKVFAVTDAGGVLVVDVRRSDILPLP